MLLCSLVPRPFRKNFSERVCTRLVTVWDRCYVLERDYNYYRSERDKSVTCATIRGGPPVYQEYFITSHSSYIVIKYPWPYLLRSAIYRGRCMHSRKMMEMQMDMNCSACMDMMMHMMTKMVCCFKSHGPARSMESTS